MSQDFKTVLVKDDRLLTTDKLSYMVYKGPQQNTPYSYAAISQSSSSLTFNCQLPSEQTIIDRRILWQSDIVLKFVFPTNHTIPAGQYPINYGLTDALAPFPLHFLTTTQSITINNNTVSMNTRDVLPALLKFNDSRKLQRYNNICPNQSDIYGSYSDALGSNNNPLGSFSIVSDNDLKPRGAFAISAIYQLNGTNVIPQQPAVVGTGQTVYVAFSSTEPLLIPPMLWRGMEVSNNSGLLGIQNMNMVFNLGDCSRVWRSANSWMNSVLPSGPTITVDNISGSRLIVEQLTSHPSDLQPSRCVVPYSTYPRYLTSLNNQIFPCPITYDNNVYRYNPKVSGVEVNTSNIQLNQIPDRLIIFVRKQAGLQTTTDSDFFLPITKVSINFNNHSGILSTASVQDLYRYSVESGSNQSFDEFCGVAMMKNNNVASGPIPVPLSGSVLALEFGRHINIIEDYYSPGSLGNFQLQVQLSLINQFPSSYNVNPTNNWEIVIITQNSGLFVTERGTSSSYTGILTRQVVLDASMQEAYGGKEVERLVGGGFLDTIKSVGSKIAPKLPALAGIAKHALSLVPNETAQSASRSLDALGYGRKTGLGSSGGGMSGGDRKKLMEKLVM